VLIFFLLIYYEQRYTVHHLNANLERRSVTPDVVVCAVEGKYLDRLVQGTAKLTVLGPEYPNHVDSKLPQHFSKTQRNAV